MRFRNHKSTPPGIRVAYRGGAGAIKAALVFIRDELKAAREKTAIAKARAKTGKAPAPGRKAMGIAMTPAKAAKKRASLQAKSSAKRARKAAPKTAEPATPVASMETAVPSDT
jgi:hypothetical protein